MPDTLQPLTSESVSLKKALLLLGNELVQRYGFSPAIAPADKIAPYRDSTELLAMLTAWLNETPEAQEILEELGFRWEMVQK